MSRTSSYTKLLACSVMLLVSSPALANKFSFDMPVSAGAASCLPNAKAHVTIKSSGPNNSLHIRATGLPPNTDFTVFALQVPTSPFGFAWYQGDIVTDDSGIGNGDFTGIFSIETTVVDLNSAPTPVVFPTDAENNPPPLESDEPSHQIYHLGMWFDRPKDAAKAGCPSTQTPFNGAHDAGIQVLNTANFPDDFGPLRHVE